MQSNFSRDTKQDVCLVLRIPYANNDFGILNLGRVARINTVPVRWLGRKQHNIHLQLPTEVDEMIDGTKYNWIT